MKTLASCTALEFLTQTNKVRKRAEAWLNLIDLKGIYERCPVPGKDADAKVRGRWNAEFMAALYDASMGRCPRETVELLGVMMFMEPAEALAMPSTDLIRGAEELLNSPEVTGFFMSWLKSAVQRIFDTAEPSTSKSSGPAEAAT
jgi:hypothetical protein